MSEIVNESIAIELMTSRTDLPNCRFIDEPMRRFVHGAMNRSTHEVTNDDRSEQGFHQSIAIGRYQALLNT